MQVFDFADGVHAEPRGEDRLGFDFFDGDARGGLGFGVPEVDNGVGTFSDFLVWGGGSVDWSSGRMGDGGIRG